MTDIYKNPTLYYILVPVIAALWSLLVWGVHLPDAERNWQAEKAQYKKAQNIIEEILKLDPDRLEFADSKTAAAEFDYASAVEKIASLCRIPSTNYKLSSRPIANSGGQKSQSAQVNLKQIDIVRFAKFLSTIQLRWANLQCSKVKLTKKKGLPNTWDVDLEFNYYY
ncbi:MAG: hypothetical protein ACYS0C_04640 [Planctomycetota bacterium]|jgi:hypothetical protein